MDTSQKPDIFTFPVRIYYEDTDDMGVVYYANYLKFFERCRTEWLRRVIHAQSQNLQALKIGFVVKHVSADYLKPARLHDLLSISLHLKTLGRAQIVLCQNAMRGEEMLVSSEVQLVCVAPDKMKITAIPDWLRQQMEPYS